MCKFLVPVVVFSFCLDKCVTQLLTNVSSKDSYVKASYKNVIQLYESILLGYDKRVQPRKDQSDIINFKVTFFFQIIGITEFDTASQKLSILGFFDFEWIDEILSWEPKSHGSIKMAKLPLKDIWYPNIKFARDLQGNGVIGDQRDGVIFAHTGDVTWTPAGIFNVLCDVTTKFYPFDRQSCRMSIYAADADSSELLLLPSGEGVGLEGHQPNSEWNLVNVRIEKVIQYDGYYYDFILDLERRTEFLVYTVVTPLVLLSILNVGIFIIPIECGEKGSIAVNLFLSYGIFITAVKDDLPHNSVDVSYFLIYIQMLLMYSAFTVIYCFVESRVFSDRADDAVSRCCSRNNKTQQQDKTDKVDTMTSQGLPENVDDLPSTLRDLTEYSNGKESSNALTWRKLLRWIDICLMLISTCSVSTATSVFFYFLSRRNNL